MEIIGNRLNSISFCKTADRRKIIGAPLKKGLKAPKNIRLRLLQALLYRPAGASIFFSYKNEIIKDLYDDFFDDAENAEKLLHKKTRLN